MNGKIVILASPLREVIRDEHQIMKAKESCIKTELDKRFEARLAHNTTNPRAEMVHFAHAAIDFATMVCTIRFEVETAGTKGRSPIIVANKYVFEPKVLHAWLLIICEREIALGRVSGRFSSWPYV